MKGFLYVVALLLSLPNLIAGTASLIIRHTFKTLTPPNIVFDFLLQVVWGLPLAAALFLLLLVFGIISRTRPYAALFALVLNTTALVLFLARFGVPPDSHQLVVFLPLILAMVGFAWLTYPVFLPRPVENV